MRHLLRYGFAGPIMLTQTEPPGPPVPPVPPAPAPVPTPDPPAPAPAPVTFTPEQQAEMNRVMAREKAEGRRIAAQEIQTLLGITPEEAKKILDAKAEADTANMTEAERIKAAGEAATAAGKTATETAARVARDAKVVIALAAVGVKPELDDKGELTGRAARILRLLDLANDADAAAITAALDKLKTDEPALFGAPATPPSGDPPGNAPPSPGPGDDALTRGRKLAEAQNAGNLPVFDPTDPFKKTPAAT